MKKAALIIILAVIASSITFAQEEDSSNQSLVKIGTNIGNQAPELVYDSPDGEPIALSSLRGQYVLINFWASWCRTCRKENPTLVEAYSNYHDKNFEGGEKFTIYSVSFDKKERSWKKIIKRDKLIWPNHVSELKKWDTKAVQLYELRGIPENLLIDGNGIIIAKNLHGENLEKELAKHIKK